MTPDDFDDDAGQEGRPDQDPDPDHDHALEHEQEHEHGHAEDDDDRRDDVGQVLALLGFPRVARRRSARRVRSARPRAFLGQMWAPSDQPSTLVSQARQRTSSAMSVAPDRTVSNLQQDVEVMKEHAR